MRYLDRGASVAHQAPCRYRFTSWNTLYRGLMGCLGPDRYRMGAEVVAFDQDEAGVSVHLADGGSVHADLLVAADGVASTARGILVPEARPRYAGYVGWRGTVGERELSRETFEALDQAITYHLMPASHILAYPIPNVDGTLTPGWRRINWVWYRNVPEGAALHDLMTDAKGSAIPSRCRPGRSRTGTWTGCRRWPPASPPRSPRW